MKSADFAALQALREDAEGSPIEGALAEARVIEVCPRKWADQIAAASRQGWRDIEALHAQTAHLARDKAAMVAATHAAWAAHHVPPPLPFPSTLLMIAGKRLAVEDITPSEHQDLALGTLMRGLLDEGEVIALTPDKRRPAPRSIRVKGWLCAEGGRMWLWGVCYAAASSGDLRRPPIFRWTPFVLPAHYGEDGAAAQIQAPLTPYFPSLVLEEIAAKTSTSLVLTGWDAAMVREATRWDKKSLRLRGGAGRMPEPYYRIEIKDRLRVEYADAVEPAPSPSPVRAEQAYCCDVRAHEKCRIVSGTLPLDPEVWAELARKGYLRLHGENEPLARRIRLERRAVTLDPERRWYAVKVWDVRAHQRHKDKPYVPATRHVEAPQ